MTNNKKGLDKNDFMFFGKRIEKLEIQINCLRKQVLDLEGKKSYNDDRAEAKKNERSI